jgi:hypothetical protein
MGLSTKGKTDMQLDVITRPINHNPRARYRAKTRVYIYPKGETVIENLINRRSRPIGEYRRVLREGLTQIGVDLSRIDYRWSQKAGCGCGRCGAGFIVDGWDPAISDRNVWIDINSL